MKIFTSTETIMVRRFEFMKSRTNSFELKIALQPDVVDLRYFKL